MPTARLVETSPTRPRQILQRFLVPQFIVTLVCMFRSRSMVSPKAEVELSPHLKLGKGVVISSFCKFKATDSPLEVGAGSGFATGCFVSSHGWGIEIGDDCVFGPNVCITSSNYQTELNGVPYKNQGMTSKGIKIGRNVWVGSSVTILDGSVVGDNCVIVANSLVNRRFPPNCIIQGNPAKILLKRPAGGEPGASNDPKARTTQEGSGE